MDKLSILGKFSFYREASSSFQSEVAAAAELASLPAGACFYREGAACGHFGLVGRGDIRVFKTGETGREITLYHVEDGQPCLVNMLCVFLGRPAMASAAAELPTQAVVIPAADFRNWMRNSDAVRSFVFETMAGRFVDVMTLIEEITFRNMDRRVAELLIRRFSHRGISLREISTTHEELAAELGTAREVVSRLLKEFERLGAITLARGRIELKDDPALRRLARA